MLIGQQGLSSDCWTTKVESIIRVCVIMGLTEGVMQQRGEEGVQISKPPHSTPLFIMRVVWLYVSVSLLFLQNVSLISQFVCPHTDQILSPYRTGKECLCVLSVTRFFLQFPVPSYQSTEFSTLPLWLIATFCVQVLCHGTVLPQFCGMEVLCLP